MKRGKSDCGPGNVGRCDPGAGCRVPTRPALQLSTFEIRTLTRSKKKKGRRASTTTKEKVCVRPNTKSQVRSFVKRVPIECDKERI